MGQPAMEFGCRAKAQSHSSMVRDERHWSSRDLPIVSAYFYHAPLAGGSLSHTRCLPQSLRPFLACTLGHASVRAAPRHRDPPAFAPLAQDVPGGYTPSAGTNTATLWEAAAWQRAANNIPGASSLWTTKKTSTGAWSIHCALRAMPPMASAPAWMPSSD